jgi:hypothetical protein
MNVLQGETARLIDTVRCYCIDILNGVVYSAGNKFVWNVLFSFIVSQFKVHVVDVLRELQLT